VRHYVREARVTAVRIALFLVLVSSFAVADDLRVCGSDLLVPNAVIETVEKWDALLQKKTLSAPDLEEFRKQYGYPIGVNVPDSHWREYTQAFGHGGCETEAFPFLKHLSEAEGAMAPAPVDRVSMDHMAEVDDSGKILSLWQVPRHSYPLTISGEELVVQARRFHFCSPPYDPKSSTKRTPVSLIGVLPDGTFHIRGLAIESPYEERESCRVIAPYASNYEAQCWSLTDEESRLERTIARLSSCH
jgi:hypothetical protein